jgi:hypothetical protein
MSSTHVVGEARIQTHLLKVAEPSDATLLIVAQRALQLG